MGDHQIGGFSYPILEYGRALGAAHPGNVRQVLDRHRKASERTPLRDRPFHQRPGMLPGPVEAQGGKRIHRSVHLRHAAFQRIEAVEGRDVTPLQALDDLGGGHPDQVSHEIPLCRGG